MAAVAGCRTVDPIEPAPIGLTTATPAHRIDIAQAQWSVPESAKITAGERAYLQTLLQTELQGALANAPRDITVESNITRIDPVSAGLNIASALVLFLPFDKGGASVEFVCRDARTGATLSKFTSNINPSMAHMRARFRRLGPAEIALRQAAAEFAAQVEKSVQ
ncbi:DUF3313 family protein [Noviluteimonas gilva]|nr:DUF3313 family protein [Lysobacter gilvus]